MDINFMLCAEVGGKIEENWKERGAFPGHFRLEF